MDIRARSVTERVLAAIALSVVGTVFVQASLWLGQNLSDRFIPALTAVSIDAWVRWRSDDAEPVAVVLTSDLVGTDGNPAAVPWPPRLDDYSDWITTAWCLGASGLYIDTQIDSRGNSALDLAERRRLADTARMLSSSQTPAASLQRFQRDNCIGSLAGHPREQQRMPVLFNEMGDGALAAALEPGQIVSSLLADVMVDADAADHRGRRPAAMALALAGCAGQELEKAATCTGRVRDALPFEVNDRLWAREFNDDTLWIGQESPRGAGGTRMTCSPNPIRLLFGFVFSDSVEWQRCPPVPMLHLGDFSAPPPRMPALADNVRGRLLVLGRNAFATETGRATTPLHKQMPSAFVQALAARQMIVDDVILWRSGHVDQARQALLTFAALAFALVPLAAVVRLPAWQRGRLNRISLGVYVATVCLIVLTAGYRWLAWNPHVLVLHACAFLLLLVGSQTFFNPLSALQWAVDRWRQRLASHLGADPSKPGSSS